MIDFRIPIMLHERMHGLGKIKSNYSDHMCTYHVERAVAWSIGVSNTYIIVGTRTLRD